MSNKTLIGALLITALFFSCTSIKEAPPAEEAVQPQKEEKKEVSLVEMTESGNITGIEKFLSVDVDMNAQDSTGRTALHVAAEKGDRQITAILLSRGADPNIQDKYGYTPLSNAVSSGHTEIARMLVEADADITLADNFEVSPAEASMDLPANILASIITPENINTALIDREPLLHTAVKKGKKEHLQILLEHNADTSLKDWRGMRAIDLALADEPGISQIECAEILLLNGSRDPQKREWDYLKTALTEKTNSHHFPYGATALHLAAERGQTGMVMYLLENKADPQARDTPGNTPLHVAVRRGYRSIAKILIDNGAKINAQDYNGNTPLDEALTSSDQLNMITMLLEEGADPNTKNSTGLSPLHICVLMQANVSTAQILVDYGAQVDSRDREGNTPLLLAVNNGEQKLADFFVANNANLFARNKEGITPVDSILSYGPQITRDFFVDKRVLSTNNEGRSALHLAALGGVETATLQALIDNKAPVNMMDALGNTPLFYSVSRRNFPQAVLLINNGADISLENNEGLSPLTLAFRQGTKSTLTLLKGRIDQPNAQGRTPLFMAANWNYPEIVEALLENGANPGKQDNEGITPLHASVQAGNKEILKMLLSAGAPVNTSDKNGLTALHDTVLWENRVLTEILISAGANCNALDNRMRTPLHLAVNLENNNLVALLLNSCAYIDTKDIDGDTPLFTAARTGNTEALIMLLEAGAALGMRNNNGQTALHAAISAGEGEAASILLEEGSDFFAMDAMGRTPVELALEKGTYFLSAFMTRELTAKQNNEGNSPLHIAIIKEAPLQTIELLLEKGSDPYLQNSWGKTPGNLAVEMDNKEAAALLLR